MFTVNLSIEYTFLKAVMKLLLIFDVLSSQIYLRYFTTLSDFQCPSFSIVSQPILNTSLSLPGPSSCLFIVNSILIFKSCVCPQVALRIYLLIFRLFLFYLKPLTDGKTFCYDCFHRNIFRACRFNLWNPGSSSEAKKHKTTYNKT